MASYRIWLWLRTAFGYGFVQHLVVNYLGYKQRMDQLQLFVAFSESVEDLFKKQTSKELKLAQV
jgi:hypothetical protein